MSESLRVLAFLASALLWAAVGVAWATEARILTRLRWNWRACPPLRRMLAALAVVVAVAYAGGKGEGTGEEGEWREVVRTDTLMYASAEELKAVYPNSLSADSTI